jgi:hypothetical protein
MWFPSFIIVNLTAECGVLEGRFNRRCTLNINLRRPRDLYIQMEAHRSLHWESWHPITRALSLQRRRDLTQSPNKRRSVSKTSTITLTGADANICIYYEWSILGGGGCVITTQWRRSWRHHCSYYILYWIRSLTAVTMKSTVLWVVVPDVSEKHIASIFTQIRNRQTEVASWDQLSLIFDPEDEGYKFLRNVEMSSKYTVLILDNIFN